MKRSAILLFVLIVSCAYRPTLVEPHPGDTLTGGNRPGTITPTRQAHPNGPSPIQPCVEVARTRCAVDACNGRNMDYVTLSCPGAQDVKRCVANTECTAN